jgi:hypothetical protein
MKILILTAVVLFSLALIMVPIPLFRRRRGFALSNSVTMADPDNLPATAAWQAGLVCFQPPDGTSVANKIEIFRRTSEGKQLWDSMRAEQKAFAANQADDEAETLANVLAGRPSPKAALENSVQVARKSFNAAVDERLKSTFGRSIVERRSAADRFIRAERPELVRAMADAKIALDNANSKPVNSVGMARPTNLFPGPKYPIKPLPKMGNDSLSPSALQSKKIADLMMAAPGALPGSGITDNQARALGLTAANADGPTRLCAYNSNYRSFDPAVATQNKNLIFRTLVGFEMGRSGNPDIGLAERAVTTKHPRLAPDAPATPALGNVALGNSRNDRTRFPLRYP